MDVNPAQAQAYIVNPLTGRKVQFANLFRTHPPTEDRIARLRAARELGASRRARRASVPEVVELQRDAEVARAFRAAMTACRSSRFLPVTRSWSPWVWDWMPLRPRLLDELVELAGLVGRDAGRELTVWRTVPPDGLLDLAVVERLERHLAPHELLLEHLRARASSRSSVTSGAGSRASLSSIDESVPLKSKRVVTSGWPGRPRCGPLACRPRTRHRSSAWRSHAYRCAAS